MIKQGAAFFLTLFTFLSAYGQENQQSYLFRLTEQQFEWVQKNPKKKLPEAYYTQPVDSAWSFWKEYYSYKEWGYYLWLTPGFPAMKTEFMRIGGPALEVHESGADTITFRVFDHWSQQYLETPVLTIAKKEYRASAGAMYKVPARVFRKKSPRFVNIRIGGYSETWAFGLEKQRADIATPTYRYPNTHFMLSDKPRYRPGDTVRFTGFLAEKDRLEKIKKLQAIVHQRSGYYDDKGIDTIPLTLNKDGSYSGSWVIGDSYDPLLSLHIQVEYYKGRHWFSEWLPVQVEDYNAEEYSHSVVWKHTDSLFPTLVFKSTHNSGRAATETTVEFYVWLDLMYPATTKGNFRFKDTLIRDKTMVDENGEITREPDLRHLPAGEYSLTAHAVFHVTGELPKTATGSQTFKYRPNSAWMVVEEEFLHVRKFGEPAGPFDLRVQYKDHADTLKNIPLPFALLIDKGVTEYVLDGPNSIEFRNVDPNHTPVTAYRLGDTIYMEWEAPDYHDVRIAFLKNGKEVYATYTNRIDTQFYSPQKDFWALQLDLQRGALDRQVYECEDISGRWKLELSLPERARPGEKVVLEGQLKNEKGEAISGSHVVAMAVNRSVPGELQYKALYVEEHKKKVWKYEYPSAPGERPIFYDQNTFEKYHLLTPYVFERYTPSWDSLVVKVLKTDSLLVQNTFMDSYGAAGSFSILLLKDGEYLKPTYTKLGFRFIELAGVPWQDPFYPQLFPPGYYTLECAFGRDQIVIEKFRIDSGLHKAVVIDMEKLPAGIKMRKRSGNFSRQEHRDLDQNFMLLPGLDYPGVVRGMLAGRPVTYSMSYARTFVGPFDPGSRVTMSSPYSYYWTFPYSGGTEVKIVNGQPSFGRYWFKGKRVPSKKETYHKDYEGLRKTLYPWLADSTALFCNVNFPGHVTGYNEKVWNGATVWFQGGLWEDLVFYNTQTDVYTFFQPSSNYHLEPGHYLIYQVGDKEAILIDSFSAVSNEILLRHIDTLARLSNPDFLVWTEMKGAGNYLNSENTDTMALRVYLREGDLNCPASFAEVQLDNPAQSYVLQCDEEGAGFLENLPPGEYKVTVRYQDREIRFLESMKVVADTHTELLLHLGEKAEAHLYDRARFRSDNVVPFSWRKRYPQSRIPTWKGEYDYSDFTYRARRAYRSDGNSRRISNDPNPNFGGDAFGTVSGSGRGNSMELYYIPPVLNDRAEGLVYVALVKTEIVSYYDKEDFSAFRGNEYTTRLELGNVSLALPIVMRTNFREQCLWETNMETDAQGRVKIEFELPDDLTTWEVHFFVMDQYGKFIHIEKPIVVSRPLQAGLKHPVALRKGDTLLATARVNNTEFSGKKELLNWRIKNQGQLIQEGSDSMGYLWEKRFLVMGMDTAVKATIEVSTANEADAEERTIPVRPIGRNHRNVYWVRMYPGRIAHQIEAKAGNSVWTVEAMPDYESLLNDLRNDLINYEYECNEQLAGKVLALSLIKNPSLRQKALLNKKLKLLLKNENSYYGWSWWGKEGRSNLWVSSYVHFVLSQLERTEEVRSAMSSNRGWLSTEGAKEGDLWSQAISDGHIPYSNSGKPDTFDLRYFAIQYSNFTKDYDYRSFWGLDWDSVWVYDLLQNATHIHPTGVNALGDILKWNVLLAQMLPDHRVSEREKLNSFFLSVLFANDHELNTWEKGLLLYGLDRTYQGAEQGPGHYEKQMDSKGITLKRTTGESWLKVTETFFDSSDSYSNMSGVKMELSWKDLPDTFKTGETYRFKIRITTSGPLAYSLVEIPLPAGMQVVEADQSDFPYLTERLYYRDRHVLILTELPAGTTEIEVVSTAIFGGVFYFPPAQLLPMYRPGVSGLSNKPQRVKISEAR